MANKFTINNKVYFPKDLDFNFLCVLDKHDIDVNHMAGMAAVGCFLAYCGNMTEEEANKEISEHVKNGGSIEDVFNAYKDCIEESGFFRALMEQAAKGQKEMEETAAESTKKSRKKETVSE